MTWPNFRYHQDDLPRLCRVPAVFPVECYHLNQIFGFNYVVKEYARLPHDEPLPWTMALQITYDSPDLTYKRHLASTAPFFLLPTEAQAAHVRTRTAKLVLPIGSAFYYMEPLYRRRHPQEAGDPDRRGTLVFPDKSTWKCDTYFDRERFARELAALPDEYQPVAVSIFWEDYRRGHHRPYERAGLRLVTSGHPSHPDFLFRQYDMCKQFKYACANDLSTSYCMAVLAGCRFFHWPTGPVRMKHKGVIATFDQDPTLALPSKQACLAASPFPPTGDGAEQRALAERFAGKAYVRPAEFFHELAAQGRRQLLSAPPPSLELPRNDHTNVDRMAGWQPWGFHIEGWAAAESRLEIPAHPGFAGVRLTLDVRVRWSRFWRPVGTITFDDCGDSPLTLWPGRWHLDIPCRNDGRPRRVAFHCHPGLCLPEQARAFRICSITWQEQLDKAAPTLAWAPRFPRLGRRSAA